ncbi:hypothetical protein LBMAG33_7350 [Candidatus Levyibacteriota bacterium]|nr:transcription termination/antitermination protein NusG [Candidatus Levybacteria bacterium]MSU26052.1 transcription termination/antitermination factor NusG [Candidatus Levybacteria bacterium]GDX62425.1 hypothetical protein LBMAG33_7350 [Candidatus Levybacteria bacterium]
MDDQNQQEGIEKQLVNETNESIAEEIIPVEEDNSSVSTISTSDESSQHNVSNSNSATDNDTEKVMENISVTPLSPPVDKGKWYIVHTYSGHEDKIAKTLKQRIETMGFEDRIHDIIVPTRNTIKVSKGKKESINERIFPGYVLVRMELNDETWLLVRTTPGVTAFIGAGNKPTPISEKEVEAIKKFMNMEEPLYKTSFSSGEAVKIIDGPFSDFLGTIDEIDDARGKVKVLVSIFGRETPVELDLLQVAKL